MTWVEVPPKRVLIVTLQATMDPAQWTVLNEHGEDARQEGGSPYRFVRLSDQTVFKRATLPTPLTFTVPDDAAYVLEVL